MIEQRRRLHIDKYALTRLQALGEQEGSSRDLLRRALREMSMNYRLTPEELRALLDCLRTVVSADRADGATG